MVAMQYKLGDTGRSRGHNGCDVLCLAYCYMCLATKVCVFFLKISVWLGVDMIG